ncbi:MAG: hypothetical protein AABY22_35270 [Nanoarchaeota archaeon]
MIPEFTFEIPNSKDLQQKLVRGYGDNFDEHMAHHPLLTIRTIRHCVTKNFNIDVKTFEAIEHNSFRINTVNIMAVREELEQILLSPRPAIGIQMMYESTLLLEMLPDIVQLTKQFDADQNNYYEITVQRLAESDNTIQARWKTLLMFVPPARAKKILQNFLYSEEFIVTLL